MLFDDLIFQDHCRIEQNKTTIMKQIFSLLIIIISFNISYGQNPYSVAGPGYFELQLSAGLHGGDLNNQSISGQVYQGRLVVNALDITPVLFAGINGSYNPFSFKNDGSLAGIGENYESLNHTSLGVLAGFTIPATLITNKRGTPPGWGLPIYVGYNVLDQYSFADIDDSNIDAKTFFVGTKVGLMSTKSFRIGLNIEYKNSTFDGLDADEIPASWSGLNLETLERTSMTYSVQISIPLVKKKYGGYPDDFKL